MTGEDKLLRCLVACGAAVRVEGGGGRAWADSWVFPKTRPHNPLFYNGVFLETLTLDSLILYNRWEVVVGRKRRELGGTETRFHITLTWHRCRKGGVDGISKIWSSSRLHYTQNSSLYSGQRLYNNATTLLTAMDSENGHRVDGRSRSIGCNSGAYTRAYSVVYANNMKKHWKNQLLLIETYDVYWQNMIIRI